MRISVVISSIVMVHAQLSSLLLIVLLAIVIIVGGSAAIAVVISALMKLGWAHIRWHSTIVVVPVRH